MQQKIAVPTYFHRNPTGDEDWATAAAAHPDLGLTVLNPNSGPGYTPAFRPDTPNNVEFHLCQQRIDQMKAAGALVLGYVTTNYRDTKGLAKEHRFTVDPNTGLVTTRDSDGEARETGWTTGFGPVHLGCVDPNVALPEGLQENTNYLWVVESPTTGRFRNADTQELVTLTSAGNPGPQNNQYFMGLSRNRANIGNVFFEINEYYQRWPTIDGIFFDEMDNSAAAHEYYTLVFEHVKAQRGRAFVVQNPGTTFPETMFTAGNVADVFMSFEGSRRTYRTHDAGWQKNPDHSEENFWHAVHACSPEDLTEVIEESRDNNTGHIYITERVMSEANVWEHIACYFPAEVAAVRAANASG
ncbi:spherulation-specific family 4 protein [Kocuria rosea]|jgi:hypothetical protein|uniref:spherulation-specific family 4 protein n=1 Tax=Kocuria rosea TaxID=1275 RepID=UPI00203E7624|nr:spherulation-specific family 4 protein [Kocuria rosea]MCM3689063.1 spherulation-specific family 4 protein [Kocuria rosea]